jgi:hypothetical protein
MARPLLLHLRPHTATLFATAAPQTVSAERWHEVRQRLPTRPLRILLEGIDEEYRIGDAYDLEIADIPATAVPTRPRIELPLPEFRPDDRRHMAITLPDEPWLQIWLNALTAAHTPVEALLTPARLVPLLAARCAPHAACAILTRRDDAGVLCHLVTAGQCLLTRRLPASADHDLEMTTFRQYLSDFRLLTPDTEAPVIDLDTVLPRAFVASPEPAATQLPTGRRHAADRDAAAPVPASDDVFWHALAAADQTPDGFTLPPWRRDFLRLRRQRGFRLVAALILLLMAVADTGLHLATRSLAEHTDELRGQTQALVTARARLTASMPGAPTNPQTLARLLEIGSQWPGIPVHLARLAELDALLADHPAILLDEIDWQLTGTNLRCGGEQLLLRGRIVTDMRPPAEVAADFSRWCESLRARWQVATEAAPLNPFASHDRQQAAVSASLPFRLALKRLQSCTV